MTEIDLEAIEARATAAPDLDEALVAGRKIRRSYIEVSFHFDLDQLDEADALMEFFNEGRADVLNLIAEVRRLRERLIEQENA